MLWLTPISHPLPRVPKHTHIEWRIKDKMQPVPRENAEALMKLARLVGIGRDT